MTQATLRILSPLAERVLRHLAKYANNHFHYVNGEDQTLSFRCFPHQDTLAESAGLSVDSISRSIRELVRIGAIRTSKTRMWLTYTICLPLKPQLLHNLPAHAKKRIADTAEMRNCESANSRMLITRTRNQEKMKEAGSNAAEAHDQFIDAVNETDRRELRLASDAELIKIVKLNKRPLLPNEVESFRAWVDRNPDPDRVSQIANSLRSAREAAQELDDQTQTSNADELAVSNPSS